MLCVDVAVALPAMHAVRKSAMIPAIMALTTIWAMADFFLGAMAPSPPSWMPIELMLANPHSAYVAIVSERS